MAEFPSEKQTNYAKIIAKALNIDLPNMRTKQSYWNFIHEHQNEFLKTTRSSFYEEDMYGIDESEVVGHILGDA